MGENALERKDGDAGVEKMMRERRAWGHPSGRGDSWGRMPSKFVRRSITRYEWGVK
jgi:hypothetical protein